MCSWGLNSEPRMKQRVSPAWPPALEGGGGRRTAGRLPECQHAFPRVVSPPWAWSGTRAAIRVSCLGFSYSAEARCHDQLPQGLVCSVPHAHQAHTHTCVFIPHLLPASPWRGPTRASAVQLLSGLAPAAFSSCCAPRRARGTSLISVWLLDHPVVIYFCNSSHGEERTVASSRAGVGIGGQRGP